MSKAQITGSTGFSRDTLRLYDWIAAVSRAGDGTLHSGIFTQPAALLLECSLELIRQAIAIQLSSHQLRAAMSLQVGIEAHGSEALPETLAGGIPLVKELHQSLVMAQGVFLVVILSGMESLGVKDQGFNRLALSFLYGRLLLLCYLALLITVHPDHIAVLDAGGVVMRVMAVPDIGQQLLITQLRRVVPDLKCLSVVLEVTVCGAGGVATAIADDRPVDTFDTPEPGVWTPESTKRKSGNLEILRQLAVDRWWCHCLCHLLDLHILWIVVGDIQHTGIVETAGSDRGHLQFVQPVTRFGSPHDAGGKQGSDQDHR